MLVIKTCNGKCLDYRLNEAEGNVPHKESILQTATLEGFPFRQNGTNLDRLPGG